MRERKSAPKIARAGFDSLFFLISWSIWKERSAKSFGKPGTPPMSLDVRWLQVAELAVDAHVVLGYSHNVSQDRFVISQNAISVRGN